MRRAFLISPARVLALAAGLLTLAALALAGQAGYALWQELERPLAPPPAADTAAAPETAASVLPPRASLHQWPAIFGEKQPPRPAASAPPVQAAPQPSGPPLPPLSSLGYQLQGLVQSSTGTWAMLSHPTGPRLVQPGDQLGEGIVVERIDPDGLWIRRSGKEPELLAFAREQS